MLEVTAWRSIRELFSGSKSVGEFGTTMGAEA